jgi:hypothetical protein
VEKTQTNDIDSKLEKNSDAAFGTNFKIRKCFHRSKLKSMANQKVYEPMVHVEKVLM